LLRAWFCERSTDFGDFVYLTTSLQMLLVKRKVV
jgi:hypothetical protein